MRDQPLTVIHYGPTPRGDWSVWLQRGDVDAPITWFPAEDLARVAAVRAAAALGISVTKNGAQ